MWSKRPAISCLMDTAIYVIAHNYFTYIEEHSNERPLELMKIDYIEL